MLDGPHSDARTYMAVQGEGEVGGKAVTFTAMNKEEARELLDTEGLGDYKIVWESTPHDQAPI